MYVATIFAPIVAPVVGLILGLKSPFLHAHSKRSLKETILLQAALLVVGICSLTYTAISLYGHYQDDWKHFSIWPMLARFIVGWILLAILEIATTIWALRAAHRAFMGVWPGERRALAKLR